MAYDEKQFLDLLQRDRTKIAVQYATLINNLEFYVHAVLTLFSGALLVTSVIRAL